MWGFGSACNCPSLPSRWVYCTQDTDHTRLVFLDHADDVMEFLNLCCVEDIEALLTHELILNVWVLLIQVIGESLLRVEVGAGTVRTDELLLV